MRQVHPNYDVVTITCACGAKFQTRSTREGEMQVEICSECHPFYTGKQKIVDREGRVERFKKRYDEAAASAEATAAKAKKKPVREVTPKKPPKMGKIVPIEVKPTERFDDKSRRRGRPGADRGRGKRDGAAPVVEAKAEAPAGSQTESGAAVATEGGGESSGQG